MSYELSFAPEFFMGPWDEYAGRAPNGLVSIHEDDDGNPVDEKPQSIYQALVAMSDADWKTMCSELNLDTEYTEIHQIMGMIRETNTCSNLNSPVEVWIDSEGYNTIRVW